VIAALRTERLSRAFGGLLANSEISLSLPVGARHALIGPNGAGKTTLINLLTGVLPPTAGEVWLGEERITHLPQHERVRRGMTRTYQITALFGGLTVLESVVLAVCERKGLASRWHRTVASHAEEADEAWALLETLHLESEAGSLTRLPPTASSGWWRSRWPWRPARGSCSSTSRPPASPRGRAPRCWTWWPGSRAT
jgi:branched-chain amino acid transport system ATP-binding protein